MAKVFTIPVPPKLGRSTKRERASDPRYVDGQRLLVEAMRYLAQSDPVSESLCDRVDLGARAHPLPHERLAAVVALLTAAHFCNLQKT